MRCFYIIFSFVILVRALSAQSSSSGSGSEDIIELSPFTVSNSSEPGYKAAAGYASMQVASPLVDPRTAGTTPNAPVTLLKRADAVAVQFVLSHSGDKQEVRNQELYGNVGAIEAAMKQVAGTRVEQREVRF